jgi:hypothetical protein
MNPTGDPERDALARQELEKELARISRNAERRVAREKAKGKPNASPAGAGSPGGPSDADGADDGTPKKGKRGNKDGTARKCANCGQVGHIKTNRKSVTFSCIFCGSHDCDPEPVNLRSSNGPSPVKKFAGVAKPATAATATKKKTAGKKARFLDESELAFTM